MKIDKSAIKEKLLDKGFTIKELAEKSGLAYSTVQHAILKNKNYSYKTVGRIARALNCKPLELIQK